jgi:hypothetical protein
MKSAGELQKVENAWSEPGHSKAVMFAAQWQNRVKKWEERSDGTHTGTVRSAMP